tara:strand:+ start:234 stop:710 length:477 start_codon:yes stop_codon:yes gene_type:complete
MQKLIKTCINIKKAILIVYLILINYMVNGQCAYSTNIYSFEYNEKTYEVVKVTRTWVDASACAISRGGVLAEINNQAEQNALISEVSNAGITNSNTIAPDGASGSYIWHDENDESIERDWIWDGDNNNNNNESNLLKDSKGCFLYKRICTTQIKQYYF